MQISNVLNGFTDAAKLGAKKAEQAAGSLLKILKPGDAAAQPSAASRAAMTDILRRYDVTDITPEDFSNMITKLRDAGAISDQDFQELSSIRTELESQGLPADESVNLVQLFGDMLRKAQQQIGDKPEGENLPKLAPAMRKLDWLQKFALIHANPDAAGIDMAA
ncbi:MAG: hypothetical protein IT426_07625 [Pirellulales bacterium]|nr:hypothetical protein [Pirellulales bacterium]